ncbi:SAF domain-containing protein [Archangium lansingense]|uniref:SAF domain-containing protein n=1 Tax=Archangium lansingense TaxID=2995310 RepID=A0ABT4A1S1_9BACT|nr:SAF domain-containing protein [Archangium lansinium]MCY1075588.1 SAF domain-containing protein [Archangium lansinium]
MRSFLLGALIGLVVSCAGVGLLAARTIPKRMEDARYGWALKPILTLTREVAVGEKLTDEDLTEIRIPEKFILESFVQPADRRAVVGRAVTLGMVKGDVLAWSAFSQQDSRERVRACIADGRTAYQEAGARARDAAIQDFSQRSGLPPSSPPPPVPAFKFDAKGLTPVVVVTQQVKEGDRIPASALEVRRMPRALVTPSLVSGDALEAVAGAVAVVPMEPGDTLRWQFLDDPEQPRSTGACQLQVSSAADKARANVARARAEAFFGVAKEGR